MYHKKELTIEELQDADRIARVLYCIPESDRAILVMMANSFISGMEAQKIIDNLDTSDRK